MVDSLLAFFTSGFSVICFAVWKIMRSVARNACTVEKNVNDHLGNSEKWSLMRMGSHKQLCYKTIEGGRLRELPITEFHSAGPLREWSQGEL